MGKMYDYVEHLDKRCSQDEGNNNTLYITWREKFKHSGSAR